MIRNRMLILTLMLSLATGIAAVVHAQPGPAPQGADVFDRLDANADGKIDRTEFRGTDENFARMDQDGDGCITREELGQAAPRMGARAVDPTARWQQMLTRFDANEDGVISADEFQGPEQAMRALDANNDGTITQEEALNAGRGRLRQGAGDAAGAAGAADPAQRWQRIMATADADGDGRISAAEWPGQAERFTALDANGDGFVGQDEMPAARAGGPADAPANPVGRQDMIGAFIRMMDSDGDGQVSAEEWANFLAGADVNQNEMMSRDELMAKLQEALRPAVEARPPDEPAAPQDQ